MNLDVIRNLMATDQQYVDQRIIESLRSDILLIEEIGTHIIKSGGKRLRPLLALISARACGYQGMAHCDLAAIIEFIHTATLLHDDVVDESLLRRGQETANAIWGDKASVLVGDFIYSRAFEMMVALKNMDIMAVMAKTTNQISEGEVLQLLNAHDPYTDEARYFDVIKRKTAILFAAACELGAILAEQPTPIRQALHEYGLSLGIAYQLVDDVLDYVETADVMGKNTGDDLAEGKPTLPLIYTLQHGTVEQQSFIKTVIENGDQTALSQIQDMIKQVGGIDYTIMQAKKYSQRAVESISSLVDSDYKNALLALPNILVNRHF